MTLKSSKSILKTVCRYMRHWIYSSTNLRMRRSKTGCSWSMGHQRKLWKGLRNSRDSWRKKRRNSLSKWIITRLILVSKLWSWNHWHRLLSSTRMLSSLKRWLSWQRISSRGVMRLMTMPRWLITERVWLAKKKLLTTRAFYSWLKSSNHTMIYGQLLKLGGSVTTPGSMTPLKTSMHRRLKMWLIMLTK